MKGKVEGVSVYLGLHGTPTLQANLVFFAFA